jgi:hypothetical protein
MRAVDLFRATDEANMIACRDISRGIVIRDPIGLKVHIQIVESAIPDTSKYVAFAFKFDASRYLFRPPLLGRKREQHGECKRQHGRLSMT